jgi:hypothetical protein
MVQHDDSIPSLAAEVTQFPGIVASAVLAMSITRALAQMNDAVRRMASGETGVRVTGCVTRR